MPSSSAGAGSLRSSSWSSPGSGSLDVSNPGAITDPSGDPQGYGGNAPDYPFIDLTGATVTVTDTDITVTLTMASIPSSLTFDHHAVSEGTFEYMWDVGFDVDGSGRISAGDISLGLEHFKSGTTELTGALADNTQASVRVYTDANTASAVEGVTAQKFIQGNVITLSVTKGNFAALAAVTPSTRIRVTTQYYNGTANFTDAYP